MNMNVRKQPNFIQKHHPILVYNFLFYRRRREVMVKRRDVTVSFHVGLLEKEFEPSWTA